MLIWATISFYSADHIIPLYGRITASEYGDILGNLVHPVDQIFPKNDASFQYDSSPIHTARSVQSSFEEHEDALQHLPWPA